jgi:hypothetical protein
MIMSAIDYKSSLIWFRSASLRNVEVVSIHNIIYSIIYMKGQVYDTVY